MEGRAPGDLFGKDGILSELTKALAERALSTEMDVHFDEERAEEAPEGRNQPPYRRNGGSQLDSFKLELLCKLLSCHVRSPFPWSRAYLRVHETGSSSTDR